jgi:hypothetical protein
MEGEKVVVAVTIKDCTIAVRSLESNIKEIIQAYLGPRGTVTQARYLDSEDVDMLGLDDEGV